MPGKSRLKNSRLKLDQFYFIEVQDLQGQRPKASTLTIHWKETKGRVGTAIDPAAENTERKKRKPFHGHFTKNSSTFICISIDARLLYSCVNTAVAVWP